MIEIKVLNRKYKTVQVIDQYESLIWTDRFDSYGDFELKIPDKDSMGSRIPRNTLLAIDQSDRIMVVESIKDEVGDAGDVTTIYKGPSFESIADLRAVYTSSFASPKTSMATAVHDALIKPKVNWTDAVPGIRDGFGIAGPPSSITPKDVKSTTERGWTTLGEVLDKGSKDAEIGHRIVWRDEPVTASKWYPIQSTKTFIRDGAEYDAFPTACLDHNDRLVVAFKAGKDHFSKGYGQLYFSTDYKTYTKGPVIYPKPGDADDNATPVRIVKIPRKAGHMALLVHTRPWVYLRISADNGETWDMRPNLPIKYRWMYPSDLIHIDDGTENGILMLAGYNGNGVEVHMTRDLGNTWEFRGMVETIAWDDWKNHGINETSIVHMGGEKLIAVGRVERKPGYYGARYFESEDLGKTWSKGRYMGSMQWTHALPKMTKAPDGTILLPTRNMSLSETNVSHAGSQDGGDWAQTSTWDWLALYPGQKHWERHFLNSDWQMYGEFVPLPDGTILLIGSRQVRGSNTDCDIWAMRFRSHGPASPLYSETYQGSDLSERVSPVFPPEMSLYPNTYFRESQQDVEVWRNLCANPGLGTTYSIAACQQYKDMGTSAIARPGGCEVSVIDTDWSYSGKAMELESKGSENKADSYNTAAYPMWIWSEIDKGFDGTQAWGKTFTVRCRVYIRETLTGTSPSNPPLKMQAVVLTKDGKTSSVIATSNSGSTNVVNKPQDLTMTFTLPQKRNSSGWFRFHIKLILGSWTEGAKAEFSDMIIMQGGRLPKDVNYFDGKYSPDDDLTPVWLGEKDRSMSVLVGKAPYGVYFHQGAVLVQSSRMFEPRPGGTSVRDKFDRPSARLINTSGAADARVVIGTRGVGKWGRVRRYSPESYSGVDPQGFGAFRLGEEHYAQAFAPSSYGVHEVSTDVPQDHVILQTGHTTLGGSIWFDELIVGEEYDPSFKGPKTREPVIFAESLDNFDMENSLTTTKNHRNVAYVTNKEKILQVAEDSTRTLFNRRITLVNGDDVTAPERDKELTKLGKDELLKKKIEYAVDGKVVGSRYVYNKDYALGDIVLVEDNHGRRVKARVVEYIHSADKQGVREYPTLKQIPVDEHGFWNSEEYDVAWRGSELLGDWKQQP